MLAKTHTTATWLVVLLTLALVGCEEQETAKTIGKKPDATSTTDTATTDTSTATDTTSTTDTVSGTDATSDTDTSAATDAGTAETGGGSDTAVGTDASSGSDAVSCEGQGGCWNCAPTTSLQLLNQCNDLVSVPFDNKARLPLLPADGTLPPVP